MGQTLKEPVLLPVEGGEAAVCSGKPGRGKPEVMQNANPLQLVGFIPLTDCLASECRQFNGKCYTNPVFGTVGATGSTYENDVTWFYWSDTMMRPLNFTLQKLNERLRVWDDLISTTNPNTTGTYIPYNTFPGKPTYSGVSVNWGSILTLAGAGTYRIKIGTVGAQGSDGARHPACFVSEPFKLLPFHCNLARGTTKFESVINGKIGSIDMDGYVFDLCGVLFFDSVRIPGYFGNETTSYDSVELEYQTGLIDPVRDEAIQKFKWSSKMIPKYLHDRLKAYGLMADFLYVSDYNVNNPDYNIKKKLIVKAGSYEPVPYKGTRLMNVTVDFKEGYQSVIKTSSCD